MKQDKNISRRDAIKMLGVGTAAVAGMLSGGVAFSQGKRSTLKVAMVNSSSGFYAQYGQELLRGVELAVEAVNAKGLKIGDTAYDLSLDLFDDKSDASTAARLVERADARGANIVIAGTGSTIGKSIIPIAQRSRIPVIATWAQLDSIYEAQKGDPYFFSAMPPFSGYYDSTWAQVAKLDSPKVRKVVMVSPNDELGNLVNKDLQKKLADNGLELAHVEFFPPSNQDFGATIERCARHEPDAFLINCYTPQILALFKQMQAVGFFPPVIIVEAPTRLVEAIGEPIDGVYVPTVWFPELDATKDQYIGTSADFARRYQDKHKTLPPDFVAACGANNVILYALAAAGLKSPDDKQGLLSALRSFDGETFFSAVKFDDKGLNTKAPIFTGQFQSGKLMLVAPDSVRQKAPLHPYPGWKQS
ncbi:ABC transporter substrate-binding protein [Pusillimonas noertemannii]|uniref:ABC transporter substrate-binding protein n=1 Tax=Pusillimonas noertemannii TaxID=305977 RepID=UPI00333ED7BA